MGTSYLVHRFDPEMLDWARECGVPTEGVIANGRDATLAQLLEVVKAIPGHTFKMSRRDESFEIDVESQKRIVFPCPYPWGKNLVAPGLAEGPATETDINGAANPDGVIKWVSLRGSGELLVAIVRQLTRTCGPQTFFADNDGIPWLIQSADAIPIGPEPWYGPLPDFVLD